MLAVLVFVHIAGGIALLMLGLLALTARKSALSRHRLFGEIYFWTLVVTLPLGLLDGVIRHPTTITLFEAVTPPTLALGALGYLMAKRRPPSFLGKSWLFWHIQGQAGSYIGVVTAASFQVFPRFLPESTILTLAYWVIPSVVGGLLIGRTIASWLPRIKAEGLARSRRATEAATPA